jgi:Protein of unknown function (DUF2851)
MKTIKSEVVVQYFWMQQATSQLWRTLDGQLIEVSSSGHWNLYDGPDFINASWRLADQVESGSVEIHLKTSDWFRHGHLLHPSYRNVGIHVVADNDAVAQFAKHTISLAENEVSYSQMLSVVHEQNVRTARSFQLEYREHRYEQWKKIYGEERAAWIAIARSMGCHIHGDEMETWASGIPWEDSMLRSFQFMELSAYFLQRAGLLPKNPSDDYTAHLRLLSNYIPSLSIQWKRKARPNNRPVLRVMQMAALFYAFRHHSFYSASFSSIHGALMQLNIPPYWQYHYTPGIPMKFVSTQISHKMGEQMLLNAFGHRFVNDSSDLSH